MPIKNYKRISLTEGKELLERNKIKQVIIAGGNTFDIIFEDNVILNVEAVGGGEYIPAIRLSTFEKVI